MKIYQRSGLPRAASLDAQQQRAASPRSPFGPHGPAGGAFSPRAGSGAKRSASGPLGGGGGRPSLRRWLRSLPPALLLALAVGTAFVLLLVVSLHALATSRSANTSACANTAALSAAVRTVHQVRACLRVGAALCPSHFDCVFKPAYQVHRSTLPATTCLTRPTIPPTVVPAR